MIHVALRAATRRPASLIAVACAVFCAAVLLTITGVLTETGLRGHAEPGRLAGADLVVSADQQVSVPGDLPIALPERATVPARLVAAISALPGVATAVGDISFPASLVDSRGGLVSSADQDAAGHGWSSTRLLGPARVNGSAPTRSGEIALDSALATAAHAVVGDHVRAVVSGQPVAEYLVTAVIDTPGSQDAGMFFADATAAQLAAGGSGPRAGTVDLIGIRTSPGTQATAYSEISSLIRGRGLSLAVGAQRGDALSPDTAEARSLLELLATSLAGVILLITGFVTASALAVFVAGQRRDLALMRAVGATPAQLRRLVATQAAAVSSVALAPGIVIGYLLAGPSLNALARHGVLPAELPTSISVLPALATIVLTGLTVLLAALGASRRTAAMSPTAAVAESRSEPREPSATRAFAGLVSIVAAGALSTVPLWSRTDIGAAQTVVAGIVGAIGLALAGPWLMCRFGDFAARRLSVGTRSPVCWLAAVNTRSYALRASGLAVPWALAIVFVLTYTFTQTTMLAAADRQTRAGTVAQLEMTAPQLGGLPIGTLDTVRRLTGVRAAAAVESTSVVWTYQQFGEPETESAAAMVLSPDATGVLDLGVTSGSLAELTGDTVAVSSDVARDLGLSTGAAIALILGDGTHVKARIVAVYGRGLGFAPFVLSTTLAAGHTTDALDQEVLIRTDATATTRRVLAAYAASMPGVLLRPSDSSLGSSDDLADVPPDSWVNLAVIAILLIYLAFNTVNKQAASIAQRRVEIAALRLSGTTARQSRAMMRREAAMTCSVALAGGLLLSLCPLFFLDQAFLGRPWPAGPAWLLPAVSIGVVVLTFLTSEISARLVLRTQPAVALRAH